MRNLNHSANHPRAGVLKSILHMHLYLDEDFLVKIYVLVSDCTLRPLLKWQQSLTVTKAPQDHHVEMIRQPMIPFELAALHSDMACGFKAIKRL